MICTEEKESESCVVVVDMQKYFLMGHPKDAIRRMLRSQRRVLKHCTQNDIPIILIEYDSIGFTDYGRTLNGLRDLVGEATYGHILRKHTNGGFTNPELERVLRSIRVKNLGFMGINASSCVMETSAGAFDRGYNVFSAEGLVEDSDKGKQIYSSWIRSNNGHFYDDVNGFISRLNQQ